MKNTFWAFLFSIALIISINAGAQDNRFTFGIKAGVNLANFSGNGAQDSDARIGFNFGVTVDYSLAQNYYLLSGLELTMKGAKAKYVSPITANEKLNGPPFSAEIKDDPIYLQMPIHLGYKLTVTDAFKILFHAGPYVAYGIGGKVKMDRANNLEVEGGFSDFDGYLSEKDKFKKFDFGIGLGIGMEFNKIALGIGYDFGLANIADNSNSKLRNMNAYFTVGYKF